MTNRLVVRGGHVFDPVGGTAAPADVLIEGDRIIDVGIDLDADTAVDATDHLVVPGFIDTHVHVMLDDVDTMRLIQTPFSLRFFQAARNLQLTLRAGITTVRDAAGADLGVKQAVTTGLVDGPDMQIAIGMLSQTGGHADEWLPSGECVHALWPPHPGRPPTVVDGVDEMRRAVRELVRAGADVLKVATTGGVISPRSDPRRAQLCDEELAVLMSEARAAHVHVMAHAQGAQGVKNAIRAGVRSIEHGVYLDDEAVDMMVQNRTWLVPTLSAPHAILRQSETSGGIPENMRQKAIAAIEAHEASVRLAHSAGVPIAMGTDAGISRHGENLRELELMHRLGISAVDTLRAAMTSAADLLDIASDVGELAPGKLANMVLLAGSEVSVEGLPERVRTVIRRGVKVR
ncbi:metal-dependent hydrolase family protein [Mycolicibacterium confluentis]|uniref:Hydrolase n=1 Tax=Mycolicibacterium confluentis TaxID=28047 RepID=A0A7I7Y3T4_9MYCO|nr:amidohydrolase family protein [Mycolicibacterium confluentis]MCV7320726.1 amidohydrolase family protein [Mycolicibacterium confluentis]ORV30360.1 hydrolase [Mycolicibacterium confluentis]BBZ35773.1 hydrolase [Mycolicibacterium confluentis]